MHRTAEGYKAGDRFSRRAIVEERYRSSDDMFDGVTYSKGAMRAARAARAAGGRSLVEGDSQATWPRTSWQVVETDDFRKAMEAASGKDLKWFFDQWVYKAGHPELKVRWRYEDADKTVRVQRAADAGSSTSRHRYSACRRRSKSRRAQAGHAFVPIVIDGRSHEFVIPCATRPRMIELDPRGWLLTEIDFREVGRGEPVPARACGMRAGPAERGRGIDQEGQDQREGCQGAG